MGAKISAALRGRPKSPEHRAALSRAMDKGGHGLPINRWADERYQSWRRAVHVRDNFTCQSCGYRNVNGFGLHAHHVQEYAKVKDLRLDVANGMTLCRRCHGLAHRKRWAPDGPTPCACGCEEPLSLYAVLRGSRYRPGHSSRVTNRRPEVRAQIAASIRGRNRGEATRQAHREAWERRRQRDGKTNRFRCEHCGAEFVAKPSKGRRYCSRNCYWQALQAGRR